MHAKPNTKIQKEQKGTTRAKQYTQFNNKFNPSNVTFFSVMFTRLTFVCYYITSCCCVLFVISFHLSLVIAVRVSFYLLCKMLCWFHWSPFPFEIFSFSHTQQIVYRFMLYTRFSIWSVSHIAFVAGFGETIQIPLKYRTDARTA